MTTRTLEQERAYRKKRFADPEKRARHKQQCKESSDKRKQIRRDILSQFSCHCCGELDPAVIEWHHVHPEEKLFEVMAGIHLNHEKWWDEVLKCIPVCCNCHRKIHKGTLCLIEQPNDAG